jgi:hypothetical protein
VLIGCVLHAACACGVVPCRSWGWPCLLSRSELRDYAKAWIQLSFKTAQHMSFISRQATEDVQQQLDHLEAGVLLQQAAADDSVVQSAAPQQQQMQAQAQRQRSLSAWALNNKPTTRQALVEATFKQLFPEDVQAVIPAQEYKAVNELLREWNRKVQVYIHAVALLDLKRQRQQHKRKEKQRQAQADAAAAGGAAAAAGQVQQTGTDAGQVSIEITSMQDKAAPVAAGGSAADAGAQPSSSSGAALNGNRSSSNIMRQGPQDAPQPSAMARPGRHSRGSSGAGSDFSDLSDSEDEMDCCTASMRKLCCCRCCSVGAIQDGGHGLTAPGADDMGLDAGSGRGRCWGLFGRGRSSSQQQLEQDALGKDGSSSSRKDVLAEKRHELLDLEAEILKEQQKVLSEVFEGTSLVVQCGVWRPEGRGLTRAQLALWHSWWGCPCVPASPTVSTLCGRLQILATSFQVPHRIRLGNKQQDHPAAVPHVHCFCPDCGHQVLAGPDTGNFIVLFKTPQAANLAAHSTVYPDTGEGEPFKVQPAPSPEDVLWPVRIRTEGCPCVLCCKGAVVADKAPSTT